MKALGAGLKVGILTIIVVVLGFSMWKSVGERATGKDGFKLWAPFHDAQGLASKSRVVIAGLTIGEISDRSLEGRRARITVTVRRGTEIWSNAVIFKKSSSLLGEFYLEIDPGTPESIGPDGQVMKNHLLGPGDQIPNVVEGTTTDELMRQVNETLPRVDEALSEITGLVRDTRALVNNQITNMANTLERSIVEDSKTVTSILSRADQVLSNINGIVADVKRVTGNADDRVDRILNNVESASSEAKALLTEARQEVSGIGDRLDRSLDNLDRTMASSASITKKIDEDEGTLGRLVNDPTIADNIEDITTDAKNFTSSLFGLQTIVGMRGEYNFLGQNYRAYASVEVRTRQNKFYLFEVVGDPKGDIDEHLEWDQANGRFDRTFSVDYGYRFTFQFGRRYDWISLRLGIKESTGGAGADFHFLGDDLTASLDVFDFTYYKVPRVKLLLAYRFFQYLYVYAGVDDVLQDHTALDIAGDQISGGEYQTWSYGRDVFLGTALSFTDQDLSAILFAGGSALGSALSGN